MVKLGPTGQLIEGHVLDVNKRMFLERLRDYDKQLYVKWNPRKLRGWGCWEVRRRPDNKTVIESYEFEGNTYSKVEYKELNLINCLMDVAFLNYNILVRLQEMDTWKDKNWAKNYDYNVAKVQEKVEENSRKEMIYNARQHKTQIKAFREMILSGLDPARLADHWNTVGSQ